MLFPSRRRRFLLVDVVLFLADVVPSLVDVDSILLDVVPSLVDVVSILVDVASILVDVVSFLVDISSETNLLWQCKTPEERDVPPPWRCKTFPLPRRRKTNRLVFR